MRVVCLAASRAAVVLLSRSVHVVSTSYILFPVWAYTHSEMGAEHSTPPRYRGKRPRDDAEALQEALHVMRIQSHDELQRQQVRHLPFKPTWARLAE